MKIVTLNFIYYFFLLLLNTNISMVGEEGHNNNYPPEFIKKKLIKTQSERWEKITNSNPLLGICNVALKSEYTYYDHRIRILLPDDEKTDCMEFLKNLFGLNNKEAKDLSHNLFDHNNQHYWKNVAYNIGGRTFFIVSASLLWLTLYNAFNNFILLMSKNSLKLEVNPTNRAALALTSIVFTSLCFNIIQALHDKCGLHENKERINLEAFKEPEEDFDLYTQVYNKLKQSLKQPILIDMLEQINYLAMKKNKEENFHRECEHIRNLRKMYLDIEKDNNSESYQEFSKKYNNAIKTSMLKLNSYSAESHIYEDEPKENHDNLMQLNPYIANSDEDEDENRSKDDYKHQLNIKKNRIIFFVKKLTDENDLLYNNKDEFKNNKKFKIENIKNMTNISEIEEIEAKINTYCQLKLESLRLNKQEISNYWDSPELKDECKQFCLENDEDY